MTDDAEYLTEEQAARLWQRAAELQAEAARAVEARAAASAEIEAEEAATPGADGYPLAHVRAAALEAGIGEEFVDAALADVRSEQALPTGGALLRVIGRLIGSRAEAITLRRLIRAPTADVVAAMEEILPNEPYKLTLRDQRGDPLRGGHLVFDIQGAGFGATGGLAADASWSDMRQVYATLRPVPGPDTSCELTLRAPVAWAYGLNLGFETVITGATGLTGLGVGKVIAESVAVATLGPLVAALVTVGVALGGVGLGALSYRRIYRHSRGRGRAALEGVLTAVAMKAQGGWGVVSGVDRAPDHAHLPPGPEKES